MLTDLKRRLLDAIKNPSWICFTWFGMTAGVSLLATPIRFTATTITRPVALDVGQVVFAALNKAELMALVLLLIVVRSSGQARSLWAACGVLALILIAQSAWLLPELAMRTQMILGGQEPPQSYVHAIYSTLELSKLGILFVTGFVALSSRK
jgi:hypothetical protein